MALDTERALERAEDFLRRHMKSKAARDAEKRRLKRMWDEGARRAGRATAVTVAAGAGTVGYGLAVAPIGMTGLLAAGVATAVAAAGMLLIPTRRSPEKAALAHADLGTIGSQAEDWLLLQRSKLPGRAAPPVDTILTRLHEMQGQLVELDPASTLAGEARRLIGAHLPRLIDSYLAVPPAARQATPEIERQLVDGLKIVASELTRLSGEIGRDRLVSFQTEGRFLESRYSSGDDPKS